MGCGLPNDAERLPCNEGRTVRKSSKKVTEKDKSHQNGLERMCEAYEKMSRDDIGRLGIVHEFLRKNTDFPRRVIVPVSHLVLYLPALQHFPLGGLHLVGIDGEEAMQLVACGVRRQIRMPCGP